MNVKMTLIFSLVGTSLIGLTVAFAPASSRSTTGAECCNDSKECCEVECDPADCVTCDEDKCAEICKESDECCIVCCDESTCNTGAVCNRPTKNTGCVASSKSCSKALVNE